MADHSPTEIELQHPTDPGSMRAQNWEAADLSQVEPATPSRF